MGLCTACIMAEASYYGFYGADPYILAAAGEIGMLNAFLRLF
jgi:hypothetical protein